MIPTVRDIMRNGFLRCTLSEIAGTTMAPMMPNTMSRTITMTGLPRPAVTGIPRLSSSSSIIAVRPMKMPNPAKKPREMNQTFLSLSMFLTLGVASASTSMSGGIGGLSRAIAKKVTVRIVARMVSM